MKTIMENINEILKESGMIMISKHDGLFKLENIKDQPQKKTFFQWFEKKFFGLLEECQNEYERFEKMKNMKYSYECPECGKINRFESEATMIMCSGCDHTFSTHEVKKTYMSFNEFYGIQEKPDWKILDVNDLSDCPDILVGNYEFILKESIELDIEPWTDTFGGRCSLMNDICISGKEYCYRKTPTKKTHEKLAEDYVQNVEISHRVWDYNDITEAYVAGRKSMESES